MVTLNEDDGVVTLRFTAPYRSDDEAAYLAALDAIGERREPFCLLTVLGGSGALSPEGRRAQALWFKRTRDTMNAACRASVIVRPHADEAMAETFRKLWSFPIAAMRNEDEGRRFLAGVMREAVP